MHAVILGNGVSGATAALRLRELRPEWRITMVSGETTYPYSRPALMYVFMGHMRYRDTKPWPDSLWADRRIELLRGWVSEIDTKERSLKFEDGNRLGYDRLLLATGSRPNLFGWPGQELKGVQGLYSLQDLALLRENVKRARRAVVCGGGLIGIELAEMLHGLGLPVTILAREEWYWGNILPREEGRFVSRMIVEEGFDLRLSTGLSEILGDGEGRVRGVRTSEDEVLDCQLVGLTAGVSPNLAALEGSGIPTRRGILVDRSLRTEVEGVFAAGDCAEIETGGDRNLLQQVWYTGKAQGRVAAASLAGIEERYEPGIWFNSAKFLGLEYQVYGEVPNRPGEGRRHLYWEDFEARRAFRVVEEGGAVCGMDILGGRLRHRVCESWIREGRRLEEVLEGLGEACFDPEFFPRPVERIRKEIREVAG